MTENIKKEIEHIENVDALSKIPQDQRLTATVKNPVNDSQVFEIYTLIPKTDEEAKDRYDCSMADIIEMGVRQMTYRPSYSSVMLNDDGTLKANAHDEIQTLLDGYTIGRKSSATGGIKAKAKVADSITAALAKRSAELGKDISLAELMNKIAKLK